MPSSRIGNWADSKRRSGRWPLLPFAICAACALFLLVQAVAWRHAPTPDGGSDGIAKLRSEIVEEARELVRKQSAALQAPLRNEVDRLRSELSQLKHQMRGAAVPQVAQRQRPQVKRNLGPTVVVGGHPITKGLHFEADYDLLHIKPMPPNYAYPKIPAFRYIEDVLKPGTGPAFIKVSNQPVVYYFPQFLTPDEADRVIAAATPRLRRSTVGDGQEVKESQQRTSQGCWMDDSVPAVKVLRDRILQVTGWERQNMEMTQVLRYQHTQHYDQHHDFMDPDLYGDKQAINDERALTFFTWLEDMGPDDGGETVLPMANGGPMAPRFGLTCDRGLRVHPRKGGAIAFYSMRPDKSLDMHSLHGGCPVKHGTKWVVPQWLRIPGKWDKMHGWNSAEDQAEVRTRFNVKPGDVVHGKHYVADYDIFNVKRALPEYDYGSNPAFSYVPDVPNYPTDVPWILVSNQPKVFYFPRLISDAEADAIIVEAKKRLHRSTVGDATDMKVSDERTSEGCWMDDSVPAVKVLRDRIQAVSGWKRSDFEMTQVLRYQKTQHYNQHVDFIDPHLFGKSPITRQRAATFFTWLMDVEGGGETVLPMANGGPQAPGWGLTCDRGLRVKPRKGAAVLFYNQRPDKSLDPFSLHGGCPVTKGLKWVVPQWLWTDGHWEEKLGYKSL